jgi:endonuclease/exonuclease/phosphatase (EEP) superfamily protein YafD
MLRLRSISLLVVALGLVGSLAATESNHGAPIFPDEDCCGQAIASPPPPNPMPVDVGDEFKIVSWNIAKGRTEGWLDDLRSLAQGAQLVMLQEAVFTDAMRQPHAEPIYWSFSPGYQTPAYRSGVMTLSRVEPTMICSLSSREPWLRSPKTTSITQFRYHADREPVLVVNMHAINFTLGVHAYTQQLETIGTVLADHAGPIIFSGDLNTWNAARARALEAMTAELGLVAVTFEPDHRTRRFGRALDYVFVRGLEVRDSRTVEVDTSDHNPLIMTLAIADT